MRGKKERRERKGIMSEGNRKGKRRLGIDRGQEGGQGDHGDLSLGEKNKQLLKQCLGERRETITLEKSA